VAELAGQLLLLQQAVGEEIPTMGGTMNRNAAFCGA
jgi:hypothetical protein